MSFYRSRVRKVFLLPGVLIGLFVVTSLRADDPYDEVMDPRTGEIRPQYGEVWEVFQNLSQRRQRVFRRQSLEAFSGDNALMSVPRVLSNEEYEHLRSGVEQRARAIRAFLEDFLSGRRRYARDEVVSEETIQRIIARYDLTGVESYFRGSRPNINFLYGPDLIRDSSGNFRPIEDNHGHLGGVGDLRVARETLVNQIPEYRTVVEQSADPEGFYRRIAEHARRNANPPDGEIVFLHVGERFAADREGPRLREILAEYGIKSVRISPYGAQDERYRYNLEVTDRGVFLRERLPSGRIKRTRVGYLFQNLHSGWLEPQHPMLRPGWIIECAQGVLATQGLAPKHRVKIKELMKPNSTTGVIDYAALETYLRTESNVVSPYLDREVGVPGVVDAILQGKVGSNATPGIEFVSDKEFYTLVDRFIEYYLKEEPILPSLDTGSFAKTASNGTVRMDRRALDRVMRARNKYVIKRVNGLGGDGVWVGPKVSDAEWYAVEALIEADPASYQFQEYTELSRVGDYIVDVRLHAQVSPKEMVFSPVPWTRGLPVNGDGKVNLSSKGVEFAVLVGPANMGKQALRACMRKALRQGVDFKSN